MRKSRLEAFSDGVIAILITIMVLELKVPNGGDLNALRPILPHLLSYVLSFVFLAIYWNNHHHMLQATHRVNGTILWANSHLLFWLSLVPAATAWLGDHHSEPVPNATYGVILFFAGVAYFILQQCIIAHQEAGSQLRKAIGKDGKGIASAALYAVSVGAAFVNPLLSQAIFAMVAAWWLIPDRRIESTISQALGD
ncbi:MAG: TMEM175 family protein [Gemmatimonadaceae bacterium]